MEVEAQENPVQPCCGGVLWLSHGELSLEADLPASEAQRSTSNDWGEMVVSKPCLGTQMGTD